MTDPVSRVFNEQRRQSSIFAILSDASKNQRNIYIYKPVYIYMYTYINTLFTSSLIHIIYITTRKLFLFSLKPPANRIIFIDSLLGPYKNYPHNSPSVTKKKITTVTVYIYLQSICVTII